MMNNLRTIHILWHNPLNKWWKESMVILEKNYQLLYIIIVDDE